MQKRLVFSTKQKFSFITIIAFIFMLMSSAHAAVIFGESFGNGLDWTTSLPAGWTASDDATSGMDDQFSITGGSDGNRYAWLIGDTGDQDITRPAISTAGFENIKISYAYNLIGSFAASDFLVVEWKKNADVSYITIQKVTGVPGWNAVSFNLPSDASDTTIDIRFRADDTESSDFILVDNIEINGSSIQNCGNGVLNNGEHCDDGNQVDDDECTNSCTLTFCGDGATQQPNGQGTGGPQNDGIEACDDGNLVNDDSCDNNCESTIQGPCGNGIVNIGEQCDDSNTVNGDGCDSLCQIEPFCGDGNVDPGEQCDDANGDNNDACKNDCTNNICGDGFVETGVEECDDGNIANGDGCDSSCNLEQQPVCGNGIIEQGEECDDNNIFNGDGCNSSCQEEFCGDGTTQILLGEQCDDGNFNNHDNCALCQNAVCGDGFFWIGNEECDDGNLVNGDGCNSTCKFERGQQCFAPVDIMLVIDKSGSMNQQDGANTRLQNAKSAAITFVNNVNFSKDTVGLASFNQLATLNQGLTNNLATITNAINALTASGQTNIGDGIKVGREELIAFGGPTRAMILLSDGAPNAMTLPNGSLVFCFVNPTSPTNCTIYAVNQSNITKLAGIEIFTIGLGVNNFTENLLKEIATTPSNYFSAPNSSQLEAIYLQIAEEICPCQGFDCTINSDQCNTGFCDLQSDQCEFTPKQQSTSCEEDGNLCTINHCDGAGACAPLSEVDCDEQNGPCQQGTCDPQTGLCGADPLPLSTSCDTDDNQCTTQHCNGQGTCVVNSTKTVPQPQQCQSFYCDSQDGQIKANFSQFPLSTTCEADGNLCTNDHCNGLGSCVLNNNVNCAGLNGQCQSGICNPLTGGCEPSFLGFPLSTPCQADNNLCTIDHCNGNGACLTFDNVQVPQPEVCRSFFCDPQDGLVKANNFALSTLCVTDNNECTIQHCDGQGNCVNNPDAELPPECVTEVIKDAKVSQGQPTSNFGSGRYMIVNPKTGKIDRSYLRLDASASLGDNLSLANLTLAVYYTGGNATGSGIQAYYCKDHDFVENTINWNNQPLNGLCSLAHTLTVPGEVVAGVPETIHTFDLLNETNFELANDDGLFTIVLRSAEENTGINHNKKYVQYTTKEYADANFRPKFEVS